MLGNTALQILVNRGPDSTFVDKANSPRLSPKPRQSQELNLMDRTRVTRHRGEYQVNNTTTYLTRTRLIFAKVDHYLSISKVFKYCSSQVINPDLTDLTQNKGRISNFFRIARPGRVFFFFPAFLRN